MTRDQSFVIVNRLEGHSSYRYDNTRLTGWKGRSLLIHITCSSVVVATRTYLVAVSSNCPCNASDVVIIALDLQSISPKR